MAAIAATGLAATLIVCPAASASRSVRPTDESGGVMERGTLLEKDLERIFAPVVKQPERPLWSSDDTLVMDEAIAAGDYFAGSKVPRRGGAGGDRR